METYLIGIWSWSHLQFWKVYRSTHAPLRLPSQTLHLYQTKLNAVNDLWTYSNIDRARGSAAMHSDEVQPRLYYRKQEKWGVHIADYLIQDPNETLEKLTRLFLMKMSFCLWQLWYERQYLYCLGAVPKKPSIYMRVAQYKHVTHTKGRYKTLFGEHPTGCVWLWMYLTMFSKVIFVESTGRHEGTKMAAYIVYHVGHPRFLLYTDCNRQR